MKAAMFALALMATATAGLAQARPWPQEPTSFRSVPFGTSEKEAQDIVKTGRCMNYIGGPRDRICTAEFDLTGTAIMSFMSFKDDQFGYVNGEFAASSYEFVRSVFIDKYGTPGKTTKSVLQNRLGAKFDQEELFWDGPKIHIELKRYDSDLTKGSFAIGTQAWIAAMNAAAAKDAEAKRAKAKDGL